MSARSVRVRVWLYVLLAGGLFCLVALEISRSKGMDRLRAENSALRAQADDAETARARIAELEESRERLLRVLDSPPPELLALRDEVARLRAQTNELASLRLKWAQAQMRVARLEGKFRELQWELTRKPAVPKVGAWVGLSLKDAEQGGVTIMQIVNGSPASRADLQVGDRIFGIDGQAIATAQVLTQVMSQKAGGEMLAFDVVRKDAVVRVIVKPMDWPQ